MLLKLGDAELGRLEPDEGPGLDTGTWPFTGVVSLLSSVYDRSP
jgi:hypothetical protein